MPPHKTPQTDIRKQKGQATYTERLDNVGLTICPVCEGDSFEFVNNGAKCLTCGVVFSEDREQFLWQSQ